MSIKIVTEATPSTCGHFHTGSSKVFVGGLGVSRVEADSAGGLIIGPGSQNVFVEGFKASVTGDAISTHGPDAHSGSRTVGFGEAYAGTGFAGDINSTGFAPKPDIRTISFSTNYAPNPITGRIQLSTSGQPTWPVTNMFEACRTCNPGQNGNTNPACFGSGGLVPPPNVVFSTIVKNVGQATSQEFSIGFWKFDGDVNEAPGEAVLTIDSAESFYPSARLQDEFRVPALFPGEEHSVSFEWSEVYRPGNDYAFGIYADIRGEATEPDEKNSASTIIISCRSGC